MSSQPIDFSQYENQSAKPIDFSQYEGKPASASAQTAPKPGFLDKEIPLDSYPDATLSGVQSIGRGVRDAYRGAIDTFDPRIKPGENPLLANPAGRTLRGLYQTGKQALEVPGAIRDINASPDPLGTYAKAAQDTSGEGAGQALTALATEGVARTPGVIGDTIESLKTSRPDLVAKAKAVGKLGAQDAASHIPVAGRLVRRPSLGDYYDAAVKTKAPAEPINPTRTLPGQHSPEVIAPPKTQIAKPAPIGPREPLALPAAPVGSELREVPTPRALPSSQSGEALATVKTPQRLIAKPTTEAFRSRSIGEEGIPYRRETPAEASMSEDEVRERIAPHREDVEGKPQEIVGVDLSRSPAFSTIGRPGAADWVKFHGDVPETAIRRISSAKPSTIDTSKIENLLRDGTGGQIPTASGKLEPNVPLNRQLLNSPKSSLPDDFTATPKSSALQGYKYDPETQHLEVITKTGGRYGRQGITPEQFDAFKNADSHGKAWNELKKSPGVINTKNGKPRALPLQYRSASPDDLTPDLEESVRQAKASKEKH